MSVRFSYSSFNVELCVVSLGSFCSSGVLGEDLARSIAGVTAQDENNSDKCLVVPLSLVNMCSLSDNLGFTITLQIIF